LRNRRRRQTRRKNDSGFATKRSIQTTTKRGEKTIYLAEFENFQSLFPQPTWTYGRVSAVLCYWRKLDSRSTSTIPSLNILAGLLARFSRALDVCRNHTSSTTRGVSPTTPFSPIRARTQAPAEVAGLRWRRLPVSYIFPMGRI
jgi:hypothetical protein